jgi:hypothetical protein
MARAIRSEVFAPASGLAFSSSVSALERPKKVAYE